MTEKQFLEQTHYMEDRFELVLAADADQRRARQIALIGKKLGRATELMAAQVLRDNARRRSQRTDPLMTSGSGPTHGQMAAQYQQWYTKHMGKICAEQKAAYDAMNPHRNN